MDEEIIKEIVFDFMILFAIVGVAFLAWVINEWRIIVGSIRQRKKIRAILEGKERSA